MIIMHIIFPSGNQVRFIYHENEWPFKIETGESLSILNPDCSSLCVSEWVLNVTIEIISNEHLDIKKIKMTFQSALFHSFTTIENMCIDKNHYNWSAVKYKNADYIS